MLVPSKLELYTTQVYSMLHVHVYTEDVFAFLKCSLNLLRGQSNPLKQKATCNIQYTKTPFTRHTPVNRFQDPVIPVPMYISNIARLATCTYICNYVQRMLIVDDVMILLY